jgi:hypothetical protein
MSLVPSVHVRGRRARAAVAGLVVLAGVTVGLTGAPSGAATKTVCAAGCDYTSIAAATAAAVNGDVITVAAGTYHEPRIMISQKGITLQGAGAGQTIIDGQLRNDLSGEGQIRVESATAASGPITVRGLTIRNAPKTPAGPYRYAVQVKASRVDPAPITFDDVDIEGVGASDYGMYVNGATSIAEPAFTFENGSITGTAYHAILFENWRHAVTVEDSTFTEPTAGYATLIGFNSDARAERTTEPYAFRRNTFTGKALSFYGFNTSNQGFDTLIAEDNVITDVSASDTGISFVNAGTAAASAPTNVTITGNRISGSGADSRGIALAGSALQPVGPAAVTGNSILGLGRGIDLVGTGLGTIDINRNRLIQLTAGVNNAASSGTVDASENWWGCNAGPSACNPVAGTGTTTVDSWLVVTAAISSPTVGSGGTATVTADLRHLNTGVVTSSLPAVFTGLETYYTAAKGSITPGSGGLASGHAPTGTYTAPTGPTTDTVIASIDGVDIPLTVQVGGSGIHGRVTSAETGDPIAGLQVRLYKDGSTGSAATTTAADGTYSFGNLTTGSYEIWYRDVSNTQWVSEYHDDAATRGAGTPIAFTTGDVVVADETLTPKPPVIPVTFRTIEGTVTSAETGNPIAGIQVRLYKAPYDAGSAATTTDAQGHYEFTRRTAGDYKLWFRDVRGMTWVSEYDGDASTLGDSDAVTLTEAANATVDASLDPAPTVAGPQTGTLNGSVLGEQGGFAVGVQVRLYPEGGTGSSATTTDATGSFTFANKPVGSYRVWFRDLTGQWVSEYYDDATSLETAGLVEITPGGTNLITVALTPRNQG